MASLTKKPKEEERNWLDLPSDVTTNILNRIGMVDILENAPRVCTAWHEICKDPAMWRVINMNDLLSSALRVKAVDICKHAVDRSQGQLVDITIIYDRYAKLFLYVADRSSQLRRLEVVSSIDFGSLTKDNMMKFPLLEELNLYKIDISKEVIETLARYCPLLKTLKVNEKACFSLIIGTDEESVNRSNEIAIAIGQNLVELRHLELIGSKMTNIGLQSILDNCQHLETLDLRACFNIDLGRDIGKKFLKKIKYLKLPNDSLEGCPYICEEDSDDDERNDDYYYYNKRLMENIDKYGCEAFDFDDGLYDEPFWMD